MTFVSKHTTAGILATVLISMLSVSTGCDQAVFESQLHVATAAPSALTPKISATPEPQEGSPSTSTNRRDLQPPPHQVDGHKVSWEGWDFEWQYREIEGLVLTDVHFQDRKLLKYIGLAEIYVPYATGSPRPVDFTLGGFQGNPMPIDTARDCYATGKCQPLNRDGKIASDGMADLMIHDEETGFAYAGANGRAPGKVMVLWSMCHFPGPGDGVNNDGYTYVIRWKFFNDGRLRAEVGATGGLQHLNISKDKRRGLYVGEDDNGDRVFAPSHVHNFYFRVDLDIETAAGNTAQEINYTNDKRDTLKSQAIWENVDRERGRYHNGRTFRSWRVMNPKSLNAHGHPRSYQLLPSSSGSWRDGSRFDVLKPDILFTKYREEEFPYSSEDATRALPAIEKYMNKERLTEEDIVAWYRVAFMHHPRTEDWPAQPIVWHGFDLIPRDFLDRSPLQVKK